MSRSLGIVPFIVLPKGRERWNDTKTNRSRTIRERSGTIQNDRGGNGRIPRSPAFRFEADLGPQPFCRAFSSLPGQLGRIRAVGRSASGPIWSPTGRPARLLAPSWPAASGRASALDLFGKPV